MPTIELVLRDDHNQVIGQQSIRKYPLNLNSQSFHDIEGAVENFKKTALPDIELALPGLSLRRVGRQEYAGFVVRCAGNHSISCT